MLRISGLMVCVVAGLACTPAAAPFTAPKGSTMGTPTEVSVPVSGGTVIAGALTLTVPPGALSEATTVSATPITATAPGHRGQAVRLGPEGITFAQPVTISFGYDDADLAGTAPEALLIAFQHSSGVWAVPGEVTLDTAARTISVKTTHFSDWAMVAGAQLRPPSGKVKVNQALKLEARRCFAQPESSTRVDAELAPLLLGFPCDADEEVAPLPVATSDWAVNGVTGGASSTGTVVGELNLGTFTAPSKKPNPNSVAVSARVDLAKRGKVLVVSNVTINDGLNPIHVRAKYSQNAQPLIAFVTGDVTDEGFQFDLPVPIADGVLAVSNFSSGGAGNLTDTRGVCMKPLLVGEWDELRATKVTVTGSYLTVEGEHVVPAITLGDGEGDCLTMSRNEAGATTTTGLQIALPGEVFSGTPLSAPATVTEGSWTFTFTSEQ